MLEKMFTTKMSADKKKLQSRFSKIRSKNGKLSKVIGGILFGIIIIAIISVGVIIAVNNTEDYIMTEDEFSDYVFGNDYVSVALRKENIVKESLKDDEEILTNSGYQWEVNADTVKASLNKISENRQVKFFLPTNGNDYDVRIYNVWSNDENNLRFFIIDNSKLELVFKMDITLDEQKFLVNLLNNPEMPKKEFYPQNIKNIIHAELMINGAVYPILVRSNLEKIEQMLSNAKIIKGATDCPIKGILVLTNQDGEKGMITLATDSCAVFVSNGTYYDYSDGDNSEMLGYFGIDSEKILHLTT